jgi:glycosyltransferase involved in cell wall biosynthesis
MQYAPNRDGVRHFAEAIFPTVRAAVPDATLYLVGHRPPLSPSPQVVVTGRVADATPYYEAARVAVVPLRAGGGTRLKILEAMAHARPVVSTSVGCEGLDVRHGEHLLIADAPSAFAGAVIELLRSAPLRARLADNGRRLVEARHDRRAIERQLAAVYGEPSAPGGAE